jgi:hypothetical protein
MHGYIDWSDLFVFMHLNSNADDDLVTDGEARVPKETC